MIKNIFALITILALVFSCVSTKQPISQTESSEPTGQTELNSPHLFSTIKRSYCYGTCPVYELRIDVTGEATYYAIKNVALSGVYVGHISKKWLDLLSKKAQEINYIEMQDLYDNPGISDLPATTTSIVINGKRKTVKRRYGSPTELLAFEALFDEIIAATSWEKLAEPEKE
ncbi:MAG: DUF6438 domain-containing protein [Crocinitomicaceae bacterium]|nr:DUF6438 domain-containing protein [Crocinitomicaceae bacterium]MDG1776172.1 DUF6438 domain-containing protein [Crocinitomicaceae bacterium]